jgi:hypothetical protein
MTEENQTNIDLSKIKIPKSPFEGMSKEQELAQYKKMYDSAPEGKLKAEMGFKISFLESEINENK